MVERMSPALREILTLDPLRDNQRIVLLSMRQDFPFDTTRSLELALFRSFCSNRISALLDRTGQFQVNAQKRYDDTDLLVSEVVEYGYDSERGRAALLGINELHGRFTIPNEDFLYVLSTFIFEPIRWNERFGWRRLSEHERQAYFHFWREVGRRMQMYDIPRDYEQFERFSREYEREHFKFAEPTRRIGVAVREMLAAWFPHPLRPLFRRILYASMDEPMLESFGFRRPSATARKLVLLTMKLRALFIRLLLPRRRRPVLRTQMRHRTYPRGYTIERLGPE